MKLLNDEQIGCKFEYRWSQIQKRIAKRISVGQLRKYFLNIHDRHEIH